MVHSSRDDKNDGPSESAAELTENEVNVNVSHPERYGETPRKTSSSPTVLQTFAPLLARRHHYSSANSLPIANCHSEIIQSPLDTLVKISPNTSVVIEELSLFSHESYCVHKEAMSENCNQCRNNNTNPTLPGGHAPPVRTEYTYKSAVTNRASNQRKIKTSRLVIIVLACIIAGLTAGLVYFLLYGKADNKAPATVPDVSPSDSTHLGNQTRMCAKIPAKYLSSAWHDRFSAGSNGLVDEPITTAANTIENVSFSDALLSRQEISSGNLPLPKRPVQARIYGGTGVTILRFPWQASLWLKDRGMFCGGALIMPNWIVTAAHCTYSYQNATDWTAYLGVSRLSEKHLSTAQTAKVERIFVNPQYESSWNYDNDISLLKLADSVRYSSHVKPICIPTPDQIFGDESSCSISGWGSVVNTGEMVPPDTLQYARVDIIPHQTCRSDEWLGEFLVTDNMICAGKADGSVDACSGDSGGPLSCYVKERGVWVVAGVVSFGRGCGQPQRPGVYTKISAFAAWIWTTIGANA